MPRWIAARVLIGLLLGAASLAGASSEFGWNSYANARFGYSICYPAGLLHPSRESDDGDGRTFTGAHGANLAVWGSWNVLSTSEASARITDLARLRQAGYHMTYAAAQPGWYVLSGEGHGVIVYRKSIVSAEKQTTFELRYPVAEARAWSPVAARLSQCLAG